MKHIKSPKWLSTNVLVFLLAILLATSASIKSDVSLSSLSKLHDEPTLTRKFAGASLIKGNVVRIVFPAAESNLGIVSILFEPIRVTVPTHIEFRIKERGSGEWLYRRTYNSEAMGTQTAYPFGFPIINNSNQKNYEIELESMDGSSKNHMTIATNPSLTTIYKYSKSDILKSPSNFISFAWKKSINILSKPIFYIFFFTVFLLIPLKASFKYFFQKKLTNKITLLKNVPALAVFLFTIADTLLLHMQNNKIYLSVFFVWLLMLNKFKFTKENLFFFPLIFLFSSLFLTLATLLKSAETAAAWAYVFLLASLIQSVLGLKRTRI